MVTYAEYFLFGRSRLVVPDLPEIGGTEKMTEYMIGLVGAYIGSGICEFAIYPILCLAFICTVPCMVRALIGR